MRIVLLVLFQIFLSSVVLAQGQNKSKADLYKDLVAKHQSYSLPAQVAVKLPDRVDTSEAFRKSSFVREEAFWRKIDCGKYISAMTQNEQGNMFAATYDEGIYRSTDNGEIWSLVNDTLFPTYDVIVLPSSNLLAGSVGGGIFRSIDGGVHWMNYGSGGAAQFVYALTSKLNGCIYAGTSNNFGYDYINGYYRFFPGEVLQSSDDGEHWVKLEIGMTEDGSDVNALIIHTNGDLYAGTSLGIFLSTDDGNNWLQVNNGLTNIEIRTLAGSLNGSVFAGTSSGVFRSTDSGINWIHINNGLLNEEIYSLLTYSMNAIFAGTAGGVFRSTDNGDHWIEINSGLTNMTVWSMEINSAGYIYAGTVGAGIFKSMESISISSGTQTDIKVDNILEDFILRQNYPNPFNPTTRIDYHVPATSHVVLKVFDMMGREVAALVDQITEPGDYTATFDGAKLSSGAYFVRFTHTGQNDNISAAKTIKILMTK